MISAVKFRTVGSVSSGGSYGVLDSSKPLHFHVVAMIFLRICSVVFQSGFLTYSQRVAVHDTAVGRASKASAFQVSVSKRVC